jgi:hypothetical protein
MSYVEMKEERFLRDFVSPFLCQELISLGIPNAGKVYWRMNSHGQWHLWSYQWDPDHIYEESDKLIFEINPQHKPLLAVVAFTTGDLLAALPPILITSTGPADWEVSTDIQYGHHCERQPRLPDALAYLLKSLLLRGRYQLNYVISQILQSC